MPRANRLRILLTHSNAMRANYYGSRALAGLQAVGDVRVNESDRVWDAQDVIAAAQDRDLIVADRQTAIPAAVFDSLPGLLACSRVAVDIRNIDVAAASRHGVLITRASPGFVPAVTEWILGAMVDATRHTSHYVASYRSGTVPVAQRGRQLHGSTIGVIGFGAIGANVCALALALGMRVLVHDPYKAAPAPYHAVDMATLLKEADFVVPLAVASEETENLIDAAALALMKPDAWLVNASRGNLVDETALAEALDRGRIAGAAMDVGRAADQMPTPALAGRPNVIASPHVGGLTPQAIEHQALETVRQAEIIARGEIPEGAVNAEHANRLARAMG
jgi:D-3-phosphoglycerate dehydrogenase